jgi:transcriptional regulator NrdR family protein
MKCQACHLSTRVVYKREDESGLTATRRHECSNPDCPRFGPDHRFTTEERITAKSAEEGRRERGEMD